jgi:WD40 repeat protein
MFNPENNKMFVSGSLDRVVRLWKIDNNLNPRQSETVQNEVTALSYSPNGKWLIVGLTTGMCTIFESKANA